jgi:hypothetical protein
MEYIREGNVLPVPFNILFLPKHVFNVAKTILKYFKKRPKKSKLINIRSNQSINQEKINKSNGVHVYLKFNKI